MPSSSKTYRGTKPSADPFDPARLHAVLKARYGPSGWWPGDSPLEVIVGAVLTQNTAWVNVEKAILNLKKNGMLDLRRLHESDEAGLASLIRSSGYYNIKARRLKNLVRTVMETGGGDLSRFLGTETPVLREILLGVNGIGRETADSICCYAGDKTIFVVDAYTRRILTRHGAKVESWDYDGIRHLFEQGLPNDLDLYKDLHAYLVFVGKEFCRPRDPRCGGCPLEGWMVRV
jgi:endonuclease III related protein